MVGGRPDGGIAGVKEWWCDGVDTMWWLDAASLPLADQRTDDTASQQPRAVPNHNSQRHYRTQT